ncbi:unnamed protein product [Clonostachys rosea f. rosea IK726]|uniref:Zn(2)-C6 fungal-type domain-containing protein n=2 Tax=Bionectria ochroleuca TaxID=29856 RepID=A0A0B7JNE3_BIOOC|nr:unnamed protein product [Clonostachys rosea f. rosea IK726]
MSDKTPDKRESRRNRRLRLACARCQKRKIRCDGQYPTCNNCKKASVVCSDGDSLRLGHVPSDDEVVAGLKQRIATLEAALQERGIEASDPLISEKDPSSALPVSATPAPRSHAPAFGSTSSPLSHEIGLVSVGNSTAPRYIGPSSGYFLARLLMNTSRSGTGENDRGTNPLDSQGQTSRSEFTPDLFGSPHDNQTPLPHQKHAKQLCDAYFNAVGSQYPILHRPSLMHNLDQLYAKDEIDNQQDNIVVFQVYMVLALGATVLSHRLQVPLPADKYFATAFGRFERINSTRTNSLPGLQCLLLLLVFTMHNPHVKLNIWYLNYQCIAATLDLGLQRSILASNAMSLLEQEMRTRVFWVVFMLDRTIATIMGRPIGVRDEACELRYPQLIDDENLLGNHPLNGDNSTQDPNYLPFSLHLFKLARLNSEIKYVANSIVRDTPIYAYPPPTNINDWQAGMIRQLDDWAESIPTTADERGYMKTTCEIRYNSLMMLLLRPSPALPNPSIQSLRRCYTACQDCIRLFNRLYRDDLLVYSWVTFHSLLLSIVTMLYCVRAAPSIAATTEPERFMSDVYAGLNILSAAGEYWPGAKRSRNVLDDLAQDVLRWVKEVRKAQDLAGGMTLDADLQGAMPGDVAAASQSASTTQVFGNETTENVLNSAPTDVEIAYLDQPDSIMTGGAEDWWGVSSIEQFDNIDSIMHNFFTDFSPTSGIM